MNGQKLSAAAIDPHYGLVGQTAPSYSDKPAPLVTLGTVADRQIVVSGELLEIERRLASMREHISGCPASYGPPKGNSPEAAPSGLVGRMRGEVEGAADTATRISAVIHALMTHLGMNEPTSMGRTG